MNILYAVNDKFVPQIGAGICSVCENNQQEAIIHFYILSSGITEQNKENLKELAQRYNRKISIIEIENMSHYFDFEFDTLGWNPVILARLLMGRILPVEVKRILYMDGDTIVRGSLNQLWNLDLDDKILGMSVEPTVGKEIKKELGIEGYHYHNSGVLLVDLDKWRQVHAEELLMKFYKDKNGNLFAADQDMLNGALKDYIYPISPKYNFCNIYYQYPYKYLANLVKPLEYFSQNEFDDAVKNPVIIHYLGEERPWREGSTHKYKGDYCKYLSMTCWKDTPNEEGWRTYFFCWKIFNAIMRPFPRLRHTIINFLIPHFMKFRANQLKKDKANAK